MHSNKALKWIILAIALAINLFIFINGFINGEASSHESHVISTVVADAVNLVKADTINESNFESFALVLRKVVGHFGLFAASGVFTSWAIYLFCVGTKFQYFLIQLGIVFALGISLAGSSEIVQLFTEGRYGNLGDVGIDLAGYFIGVFAVFLINFARKSPIFYKNGNAKS